MNSKFKKRNKQTLKASNNSKAVKECRLKELLEEIKEQYKFFKHNWVRKELTEIYHFIDEIKSK